VKTSEATARRTTAKAPARRARALHGAALAAAAAAVLGAPAGAAAVAFRTASMLATDGDALVCQVVNWDGKPRDLAVRIVLANDGSEAASVECDATPPRGACAAIESVFVPILSSGFFACEVEADGPKTKFRGALQNLTKGVILEAR
jgi:hypothetical protein